MHQRRVLGSTIELMRLVARRVRVRGGLPGPPALPRRGLSGLRVLTGWLLLVGLLVVATACRAGRAPPMPQPTNFAQFLAIAVFVIGGWWLVLKILRG